MRELRRGCRLQRPFVIDGATASKCAAPFLGSPDRDDPRVHPSRLGTAARRPRVGGPAVLYGFRGLPNVRLAAPDRRGGRQSDLEHHAAAVPGRRGSHRSQAAWPLAAGKPAWQRCTALDPCIGTLGRQNAYIRPENCASKRGRDRIRSCLALRLQASDVGRGARRSTCSSLQTEASKHHLGEAASPISLASKDLWRLTSRPHHA